MPYYTIGYEGVKLDGFILCLEQHGIQVLADVREKPYSRKPGFSQRALRDAVSSHGIRYQHFQRLGCPPDIRSAYQEDGDWGRYRMAFNQYLTSNLDAVKELVLFTRNFPCALMCFEADPAAATVFSSHSRSRSCTMNRSGTCTRQTSLVK